MKSWKKNTFLGLKKKEQLEKFIKNDEDYMKPSTLNQIKAFEKEIKNKEKTNTKIWILI